VGSKSNRILVIGDSTARDVANIYLEKYVEGDIELIYRSDFNHCNAPDSSEFLRLAEGSTNVVFSELANRIDEKCAAELAAGPFKDKILFFGIKDFGYNISWVILEAPDERGFLTNDIDEISFIIDARDRESVGELTYVSVLNKLRVDGQILITDGAGCLLSADNIHLTKCGAQFLGILLPVIADSQDLPL